MKEQPPTCERCAHAVANSENRAKVNCHLNPPQMMAVAAPQQNPLTREVGIGVQLICAFPMPDKTQHCAQWEPAGSLVALQ